ncbi:hypothetical protein TNCV_1429491 [Trichonephila clavipes]|nr:hypothetical protein TNCV_1429491 [Trichonephila clavipes]
MSQFQSPLWIHIGGHICFDPWYEPRLRAASLGAVLSLVLITFVIGRRGSLEVKVTDSWPAYHKFKPSTSEDPRTLNMLIIKRPLIGVKVRRGGVIRHLTMVLNYKIEETHTSPEIPEMSNKPNVNEISKAHLDQKEQEVELQAVKTIVKICKISTPKENIDRILEEVKKKQQYKINALTQLLPIGNIVLSSPGCNVRCI